MSLKVYLNKSDLPEGEDAIHYNDKFFDFKVGLRDDEITRDILQKIDGAKYSSSKTFISRDASFGALNKSFLSTGCKTLLNIVYFPDKCFDVIECGQNVIQYLSCIKNGRILWERHILLVYEDKDCDMEIDGKKFKRTLDVAEYFRHRMKGDENGDF